MVVLKKIKASTLMETMVGTVLIVVIFMLSSLVMNSLFSSQARENLQSIGTHLNKLEYLYINKKINLPFSEEWDTWDITIGKIQKDGMVVIEAIEKEGALGRTLKRKIYHVKSHQENRSFYFK